MMISRAKISILLMALCLGGCSPSSDSSFANLLESSNGPGIGSASIAINSYLPNTASVVLKADASETFLVSAIGDGTLNYKWTLNGVEVGSNSPQFLLDASTQTIGVKELKVVITDNKGTVSQTWNVKINGTPVISSPFPSTSVVGIKQGSTINFSVMASDPNSDTLTYTWKINGSEGIITSTSNTASYTPSPIEIGSQTVSVTIRDGAASDSGTYTVSQSWTMNVNNFADGCNEMENNSLTNRTCVVTGYSNIGNDLNPDLFPQSINMRPTAVTHTASGDVFIADNLHNVIRYWNRGASAVTVLGITVPAGAMKIVAGSGASGTTTNTSSTLAVRAHLNGPHGLFFDGTDLYFTDTGNNLVRKIDSSNVITTLMGVGASHVDGAAATTHSCSAPYGIVKSGNNLFVACGNNHRVKRIDLSTGNAYTFAGTGTAGNAGTTAESSPTDATNGRMNLPYGLALDDSGNLFIGEYSGCRVRFVNRTASTVTFYGSYTVSPNQMRTILGSATAANCGYVAGEAVNLTATADAQINNPRSLFFSGNILYLNQHSSHSVVALNLTGSARTFGAVSVAAYNSRFIIGNTTGGYLGEGTQASATRFNTPYSVSFFPSTNEYLIADYSNMRLRRVNSSFTTELVAGSGVANRYASSGNGEVAADIEKTNLPREMAFDAVTGDLFYADTNNQRIRKISKFGVVSTAVGLGTTGSGAEENEVPTNITMNQPLGLTLIGATSTFGGHLLFTDSVNHRVRFWNRSSSNVTYFGVLIEAGKVATVAGTGTAGNTTTGSALSANLNSPEGVASDGTNLYIADRANHCIKKVDSTGTLTVAAGTCGTAGNVNGAPGTARLNNPRGLKYYENGSQKGIFIADTSNSRIRFMRLSGSAPVAGVPISAGDTNSVACGGAYHDDGIIANNSICSTPYSVTVAGNKFCFANYGYHNVRCVDISTGMISTVMGPLQGVDSSQPKWFPGTAFTSTDQSNVVAAAGVVDPALTDSFGVLNFPLGITNDGSNRLFISEWGSGLVRKVVLP